MDDGNHKSIENVKPHVFLGPEAFKKQTNLNKKIIQKNTKNKCMFYIFAFFGGGGGAESWPVWGGLGGGPRAGSGRRVSGGAESKIWRKGLRGGVREQALVVVFRGGAKD